MLNKFSKKQKILIILSVNYRKGQNIILPFRDRGKVPAPFFLT